jgi:5,10-methylenetetrahydromethanopterin reductase
MLRPDGRTPSGSIRFAPVPERRIGLLFVGAPTVPEIVRLTRRAEERGFDSAWMAETRLTRDGFVPLAAMAAATERIKLGTGIVNVYTRGPVVLAITYAALAELAPGRIVMGLGAGSPLVLAPQGVAWEKPVPRLREYVDVLRPLLRGDPVSYEGEFVRLAEAQIQDVLATEGRIGGEEMPLYLGATGRKAVELAGEVADGILMNVCLPTAYVERALGWLAAGAERAGREIAGIDVGMAILCSPDADSDVGKDRAHRFCALYLSLFPNIARETGLDPVLVTAMRQAFERDGVEAAVEILPRDAVDRLCAAGTAAECRTRIDEYRAAGVDLPVVTALEGTIELAIDTLA